MELRICHLYPDVLNLYGDRGNIACMRRRLTWRGINCHVTELPLGTPDDLTDYDLFFIGGGQDFEQTVLLSDLAAGRGECLRSFPFRVPEHDDRFVVILQTFVVDVDDIKSVVAQKCAHLDGSTLDAATV